MSKHEFIIERTRNGKSEICVVIPFRDSETGKRRQIWRSAQSITEAKRIRDELLQQIRKGGTKKFESRISLNEYLDKWLASVAPTVREVTYEDYEAQLRRYVRPTIGNLRVTEVEPAHIQSIVKSMQERGLEARTIQYMHRVISMALKAAVKQPWNLLPFNPASYVKLPQKKKKERVWLTDETIELFLESLEKEKHGLMFEFALISAMRPEEYLALKWSDIDFTQYAATVNRTLYVRRGIKKKREFEPDEPSWRFEETKTESSRRLVPLPRYLASKLLEHKRKQNEHRLKMGNKWQDYNLVFTSKIGTPLNSANVQFQYYKPLLKRIGLERMRLYDLRHSFASLLLKVRENKPAVPLKVVSEMLGHSDPYTTARLYHHVDESMKRQASDTMEAIVRKVVDARKQM